jgi:Flp pilus assembly protein CpaB
MFRGSFLKRRTPPASKALAVIAIACGLAALMLVRATETRLAAAHPSVGSPVPVIVMVADADRGATLDAESVRADEVPSAFAPPGALGRVEQVIGKVLAADVIAGEVLTRTRLAASSGGPVATLVPAGLRAVDVTVEASAKDLRPGDRVDVLAAFGGGSPHTETVAEGLEVLRVEATAGSAGGGLATTGTSAPASGAKASLLLLVSPYDADRLAFARAFASLSIAIVPAGGDSESEGRPTEGPSSDNQPGAPASASPHSP